MGKAEVAKELLTARDLAVSCQVLQEFYVKATRPSRSGTLTRGQAADLVSAFSRFQVQETTLELAQASIECQQRFGLSCWDSAIIEAATALGATQVLSEDLSDGQDYDGVSAVNPFW